MKGDLYAQGKTPHELQEAIDYMGKVPLALFFFIYHISPKSMTVKQRLKYQPEADS